MNVEVMLAEMVETGVVVGTKVVTRRDRVIYNCERESINSGDIVAY